MTDARPRILLVDDEPHVLEGLALSLRRRFDVSMAAGPLLALEMLASSAPFAVVVSDMCMPQMDGARFLGEVRSRWPEVTRVLLTGHADTASAARSVNEGQIFRFLSKPCAPPDLIAACNAAAEQHDLVTAQRVLLEDTLRGSIKALIDVLALAQPEVFGHAMRIRNHVRDLARALGWSDVWMLETAAMLSQIGRISVPAQILEKEYQGRELSPDEVTMIERSAQLPDQLFAGIPRIDALRATLRAVASRDRNGVNGSPQACALRIAVDFDRFESRTGSASQALASLRAQDSLYDPTILDTFLTLRADDEVPVSIGWKDLRPGMVLALDIRMKSGVLLMAHGCEVTVGLLERIRNYSPNVLPREVTVWDDRRLRTARLTSPRPAA